MGFLHINKIDLKQNSNSKINPINKLNTLIQQNPKNKIFMLVYMEGCGPCNATRPEWKKLKNILHKNFVNRSDIVIVDIDKDVLHKVKYLKQQPASFPSMRFITNKGELIENYEDSDIETKDRTIDSFIEWIKHKSGEDKITISDLNKFKNQFINKKNHLSKKNIHKRKTHKKQLYNKKLFFNKRTKKNNKNRK